MVIEFPQIGPSQKMRILAINGIAIDPVEVREGDVITLSQCDRLIRERNSAGEVIEPQPVVSNFVWIE